jgi:hypothetical protein
MADKMSSEADLTAAIRRAIERLFRGRPPHGDLWNEESSSLARSLRPPTRVDEQLLGEIESILRDELAGLGALETGIEASKQTTGNASVVFANAPAHDRSVQVLISDVFPVTTVRMTRPASAQDWPGAAVDLALLARLRPLLEARGIQLLPADSPALSQTIKAGWVRREPAWKYLFHLGLPTG